MKNVLLITTVAGFISQFEMDNVRILKENGYSIHYASNFDNAVYEVDYKGLLENKVCIHNISIKKSPLRIISNLKALSSIVRIIKEYNINLIHCHTPVGAVLARVSTLFCNNKIQCIYTTHGLHFYKGAPMMNWLFFYPVERLLARLTDIIITINTEDYNIAKSFKLKRGGNVFLIPGVGVDTTIFYNHEDVIEKEYIRKKLQIPHEAFHVVSVGELNSNKNHLTVIKAIKEINNDNIHYTICGDGPLRDTLIRYIKENNLETRVHILGFKNNIDQILQTADVFVFPSIREGLGIAAIEAMLCSVPTIVSDNRGTREYAIDKENVLVCKSGKIEEYKELILELFYNHALYEKLKNNSRKYALKYDIKNTSQIMRGIYKYAEDICNNGSLQSK